MLPMLNSNIKNWLHGIVPSLDASSPARTSAAHTPAPDATPRPPSPQLSPPFDDARTLDSHSPQHAHDSAPDVAPPPSSFQFSEMFNALQEEASPTPIISPVPELSRQRVVDDRDAADASSRVRHTAYGAVSFGGHGGPLSIRLVRNSTPIPSFREDDDDVQRTPRYRAEEGVAEEEAAGDVAQEACEHNHVPLTEGALRMAALQRCLDNTAATLQAVEQEWLRRSGNNRARIGTRTLSGKVTKKNKSSTTTLQQTPNGKYKNVEKLRKGVRSRTLKSALKSRHDGKGKSDVPGGSSLKHKGKKAVRFSNDDDDDDDDPSHPRIPTDSEVPSVRAPRHSPFPGTPNIRRRRPTASDVPDDDVSGSPHAPSGVLNMDLSHNLPSGVGATRSHRKSHKSDPYGRPKIKKAVRFAVSSDDGECHPPTLSNYYRPPDTPYVSAMALPGNDIHGENLVPTRPNTPPTETSGLGLSGMTVVRRLTAESVAESIRIHMNDDDNSSVVAEASDTEVAAPIARRPVTTDEIPAIVEQLTSQAYLTPDRSNPGLYAGSNRSTSPVESPLPKTPISPTDSEVAVRSPKPPGYEEIFGRSDDEDSDDLYPSASRKSEKPVPTENAPTAPSQRLPTPPPAQAPALTKMMDIPVQTAPFPSPATSMVAPQREMSWTTLPISPLPIAPQPFQLDPAPASVPASLEWGQATQTQAPQFPWSPSAPPAPSLMSTWMAPPAPVPSSFPPQSAAAFYQPTSIHPIPSVVYHVPPPQPEVDMSMDVDPFLDVVPSHRRPSRHHSGRDYRRAAWRLLRVAAVVPGLNLRKHAARRLFKHLSAIRPLPTINSAFQDDRALRKGLAIQRRNRHALRRAWRSVRPALKRRGPAARQSRSAPQAAPQLLQRTMSIDMVVKESSQTSLHFPDDDVDMDCCDVPAVPIFVEVDETMTSEPAIPPPALLVRSGSEPAMSVDISVPTIVVTPGTPLVGSPPQEKPRSAPAPSASSLLSTSFIPRPVMTGHSEKQKAQAKSPLRQENSLAEFEVPLVEAAAPAATSGAEPEPEPPVVVEHTPVTVDGHTPAVVEAGSVAVVEPTPAIDLEPAPAAVPEAAVKTKPPVTETRTPVTETPPAAEETGYETDDETEWEPVPVPPVPSVSHASPIAKLAVVEENTPTCNSAPVEQEGSAGTPARVDVPAPNVATEGPQIVFQSYTYDVDDDDTVSLGGSEEDDEYYEDDGREESGNEEDYEDDGRAEEESEAEYTGDDRGEEDDEEQEEYESTADEDDEEADEENNEYDESPPNYGVVKRPSCSASAPVSASVSLPTSASPLTLHPAPDPTAPSPVSFVPPGLPEGAYIGTVGEGFDWSTVHNKRMQSLANTANVSSGNPLSGEAAMRARNEARRRNYENQLQQKTQREAIIRKAVAEKQSNTVSPPILPETTTHPVAGEAPIVVDKDVPGPQSRYQDRGPPKQVWKDFVVSPAEDAETAEPRLRKGKGKGTDLDAVLEDHALVLDASSEENIRALGLTPAEAQFNLTAFSKADAKGEAPPSYQCHCRDLANGPSRGHTLTCKNAHGVSITPISVPRPSPSPTAAPSTPPARQDSQYAVLQMSPQAGQFSSMPKTDVDTTFVDQGELKSTPPSIGLATTPVVDEEPPPDYEFVKEDANLELTGVAMPCNDLFAIPADASTALMQSSPEPEELSTAAADCILPSLPSSTHPPTTVDPSTSDVCGETRWVSYETAAAPPLPHDDAAMDHQTRVSHAEPTLVPEIDLSSTVDHNLPLDERRLNSLSWIPEPENVFDIGADVVRQDTPVFALPIAGNADGSMSVPIPPVQEYDNVPSSTEAHEEVCEVEAHTSYPLPAPSNDEQYDRSSRMTVQVDVPVQEQPQPESEPDAQVLAASPPHSGHEKEPSLQEATGLQSPHPSESPLSANLTSQPLVDLAAPLPPTSTPTALPAAPEKEIAHPVAESHAEASDGIEEASPVMEQEVEEESPAPEVPVQPSTPLVRRRSGGPHDRIAFPQERRTYFGPRPCPAQWNAFLRPSPPNANRVPSYSAKKAPSPSTSPTTHWAAHPCGVNELRTTSTSTDTTAIREPVHPRSIYRERSRPQSTIPSAMDRSRSKKDVVKKATKGDTSVTAIKARKGNGDRRGKEEAHGPCPFVSAPSASHIPCLATSDRPSTHQAPSLPSWTKLPCCPDFSWTGRQPCIHSLRASGQLAGTRWESESSDSELEDEKDVPSSEQGWSAGYLAKLSLAVGAFYLLERVVF